jgi:hypothetical protein
MRKIDYKKLKMIRLKNLKMLRRLERKESKIWKNKMLNEKLITKSNKRNPN